MLVTIHPVLLRCHLINTHFTGKSKSLFLFINSFHFLLFIIFYLLGTFNSPTHTSGVHPYIKNPLWNGEWDQFNDTGSWCVFRFSPTPFSQKSVLRCRLHETQLKPCFQNEWKEDTDLHRDSKPDGKLKSLLKQFYSFDRFNRKLWTLPRLGSRVDAHQLFCWSGMLSLTLPRPFSSLLLLLLSSSVPAQLPEPVSMVTPGELCWGENKRAEKPRGPCVQTESGGSGRVGGRRKKAREVSREVAFCDLWRKWGRPLSSPAPPYCFILAWSSCSQTLSETNCMKTRKSRCVWRVGDPKTTTAPPSPSAVLLHPLLMLHNQRTAHAQENRRPPSTQRCQRRNTRTRGHKKLLVGFCCFHLSADQLVEQQSGKTLKNTHLLKASQQRPPGAGRFPQWWLALGLWSQQTGPEPGEQTHAPVSWGWTLKFIGPSRSTNETRKKKRLRDNVNI